jgi:hypothetical protein
MLRQILGLRKFTPHAIVCLESGGAPLTHPWLLRCVTCWNNLGALPPTSLFRRMALDSVSQALLGAKNWASSFGKALVDVGYPFLLAPGIMEVVDSTLVHHLLAQQLAAFFVPTPDNIHPRLCPSASVIACTYARWFQQPVSARNRAPLLHLPLPPSTLRLFFRFRSGCSGLPINTGRRWRPFPIPWAQRFCLKCASQLVCDEFHVVFECTAFALIREQFSALFTSATQSMLGFMWQKDAYAVAVFVARCLRYLDVANT